MKKKTYVLMISKVFPASHPRKGHETHFMSKILLNFDKVVVQDEDGSQVPSRDCYSAKYAAAIIKEEFGFAPKLTTIRQNYDLWARRAMKINAGEAVLSLRQWSGKPYGSKQVEFLRLEKIGVQRCQIFTSGNTKGVRVDYNLKNIHDVAKNDGLTTDDFFKWFKKDMEGCVIHFSDLRY